MYTNTDTDAQIQHRYNRETNLNPNTFLNEIKYLLATDVGLCPNGWSLEENRPMCYLLVQRRVSWLEAQEHCQTLSDNKVKCEY